MVRLLNGREAAWRGVAGNALGAASGSPPKPGKMGLFHKTRDFRGRVHRLAYSGDIAAGQLAVFPGGPSRTGGGDEHI